MGYVTVTMPPSGLGNERPLKARITHEVTLEALPLAGIHWVIVGGESGHHARPMAPEWVRSIRDQCRLAGVPFFFKQWGGVMKSRAGRVLDGRTWDEMPKAIRAIGSAARAQGERRIHLPVGA